MKITTTTEHVFSSSGQNERVVTSEITEIPAFDRITVEPDLITAWVSGGPYHELSREAAEALHAALGHALGLQYDMEPTSAPAARTARTFIKGDSEPEGVRYVRDGDGDLWSRRTGGRWLILNGSTASSWDDVMTHYGPLTEVPDA
jgi:hypothetical protein